MHSFQKRMLVVIILLVVVMPISAKRKKLNIVLGDESAVVIGGIKITIGEAIRLAVENNRDILSQSYDVAMTDTDYKSFLGKYKIRINGEAGYKYQKNLQSQELFSGKDSTTVDGSLGVSKTFSTGTTISTGVGHTYSSINRPDSAFSDMFGPNKYHQPTFYASIQQELLRNFLGSQDRKRKKMLKNIGQMQKDVKIYQLSYIVLDVIKDYWSVLINKVSVENANLQLIETRKVRNITARNVRLGLADNFNLNLYNALVASAEADLANAKFKFKDSLRKFLTTINQRPDLEVTGATVFSNKIPRLSKEVALKAAYTKRADYRMALMNLKNAKLNFDINKDATLPSLQASLSYNSMSQQENLGSAYGDSFGQKYPGVEARLKMSYPLGDTALKVNMRNAKFNLQKARIELEKLKRQIKDEVFASVEQIQLAYKLYKKSRQARIQSEIYYWRMLRNMRRGRLTAATVKNGVDQMIRSRMQELQSLVNFNLTKLHYYVSKNELFEEYKINPYKYIPKSNQ